jgi:replication-associated recombination protein RarA
MLEGFTLSVVRMKNHSVNTKVVFLDEINTLSRQNQDAKLRRHLTPAFAGRGRDH